jgi:HSP20 family molecular chaperone IbpA
VLERSVATKYSGLVVERFWVSFDDFIDRLLAERWRTAAREAFGLEAATVSDCAGYYEIRVDTQRSERARMEVEVVGERVRIRLPDGAGGVMERSFSFPTPIDPASVSARLEDGVLVVIAPKQKPRRIMLG